MAALQLSVAYVEIILFLLASTVMLVALFVPDHKMLHLHWATVASLVITALLALPATDDTQQLALNGFLISTPLHSLLKTATFLAVAACLSFSTDYLLKNKMLNGDFLALVLFSTFGMSVLISGANLLSLYLGLEIMSLSIYALIALKRQSTAAAEAALKYFILGALASGLFLYGVSMIYGVTAALSIAEISEVSSNLAVNSAPYVILVIGLVFMLSGLMFKLGVVPFHMWLPDVYHASPTPITLFIASAPKIAIISLVITTLPVALPALQTDWQAILNLLAAASLILGNLVAIAQTNLKRMLAYSSIAHSGFLVLGIASNGIAESAFYVSFYALMTIGAFGAVLCIGQKSDDEVLISDLAGMAERNVWLAIAITLLMLSMAGIPPTVGFISKLLVLKSVVASGHIALATLAVIFSVVGAYYYLRLIRFMFFEKTDQPALMLSHSQTVLISVFGLLTLLLGIFPGSLVDLFFVSTRYLN